MSITKSQTEKIGSIFNGNRFTIPTYQRKYSWTDTERKDLWQDIEESIGNYIRVRPEGRLYTSCDKRK